MSEWITTAAGAAAAETGMPAMPSKAPALKRLGKRKAPATQTAEITENAAVRATGLFSFPAVPTAKNGGS